jgi:hypothetical protein
MGRCLGRTFRGAEGDYSLARHLIHRTLPETVVGRPSFQYHQHTEIHFTAQTEKQLKDLAATTGQALMLIADN